MIDLTKYQETCYNKFIIKDNPVWQAYPLFYYFPGLLGEVKELQELVQGIIDIPDDEIVSELGDIVFYTCLILKDLGTNSIDIDENSFPGTFDDEIHLLNLSTGEIARQLEKLARKTYGILHDTQKQIIIEECTKILGICHQMGYDYVSDDCNLKYLMDANVKKLTKRLNENLV